MSYRHLFKALQWGLILFCLGFAIVGGVVAERLLELLHCQPHANPALRNCAWLSNALGMRLTPFLTAGGVTDYPFVLLHNFWALIALWVLALVGLRRADRNAAMAPGRSQAAAPGVAGAGLARWAARTLFWALLWPGRCWAHWAVRRVPSIPSHRPACRPRASGRTGWRSTSFRSRARSWHRFGW